MRCRRWCGRKRNTSSLSRESGIVSTPPEDWPNRAASRMIQAGGLAWHVQVLGRGTPLLLVHGTGASTHSWRDLAPLLAQQFQVIAPDLPGHGFTGHGVIGRPAPALLSLPGMARALHDLLDTLGVRPAIAVGHSAGAAILARMCLDRTVAPRRLISLNGAFLPPAGTQTIFSPIAKLLAKLPPVPHVFAWRATDPSVVNRLLRGTGSTLDPRGVELYRRLARNPDHVAGALGMMANWDLRPLLRDLPRLATGLVLVVGAEDRSIPPADAARIRRLVPGATVLTLPRLGHLAHEERPREVATLILRLADAADVAAPAG